MAFDTGRLRAAPRSPHELHRAVGEEDLKSADTAGRYSGKPGTFRFAGYDIGIEWDRNDAGGAAARLTADAHRARGLLTRVIDWLFRGIPFFGGEFRLSAAQCAYLSACDRQYVTMLTLAAKREDLTGRPGAEQELHACRHALVDATYALWYLLAETARAQTRAPAAPRQQLDDGYSHAAEHAMGDADGYGWPMECEPGLPWDGDWPRSPWPPEAPTA